MLNRYVSEQDLKLIACTARRMDSEDPAYRVLFGTMNDLILARQKAAAAADPSEHSKAVEETLESFLDWASDRNMIVSAALTALSSLQEKHPVPAIEVTEENYEKKVAELTEMLLCYRPTEHELHALSGRICSDGAMQQAAIFHLSRVKQLTAMAAAIYSLTQEGKLDSFSPDITPEAAAAFVLADDSLKQLRTAAKVGNALDTYLLPTLLICALVGSLVALGTGVLPAVPASIFIGAAILASAAIELIFRVSINELIDDALNVANRFIGDAAAKAVIHCTMAAHEEETVEEEEKLPALPA